MSLPCLEFAECMTCVLHLPFTDDAFKGHFGKVHLERPPLSTVVKLLCLQHVTEVVCVAIQGCEVSTSMSCGGFVHLNFNLCKVTSHCNFFASIYV